MKQIILELLEVLREDIKRRSFDESGEQKSETLERIEVLRRLSQELRTLGDENQRHDFDNEDVGKDYWRIDGGS